ncbi:Ivy family c-type lysozyme inhibitor [Iodobacter sp.]|uniref:Ivy family c-type lysozyme inhibitor n=1 Tax=Iodobacter sp. TaxID=1915058 RepID=UPI0025F3B4F6|nr:Ivy family c-type lysozyme inhibitor [Iodobacter sp.]
MQWISRISICSSIIAALFLPLNAQAKNVSSTKAMTCTDSTQCAYFYEVYPADKMLRQQLNLAFTTSKIKPPRWLGKGTSTPMIPIVLGQIHYLAGSVCEPHNCGHSVYVLYAPAQKRVVAHYQTENGPAQWLGEPNPAEQQLLTELETANSPLQTKLDSHPKLPIIVD